MSDNFAADRLLKLLRIDLVQRYRSMLTASAAIGAVMILQAILFNTATADRSSVYWGLLGLIVFGWGPIAASHSFRELNNKSQNEAYLLLPASALEKMLSRLVLTIVIFPIYALVLVTLIAWLTSALRAALFGIGGPLFLPLEGFNPYILGLFLLHQSMFFLGAAWFQNHHFVRTILTLGIGSIGLVILIGVLIRIFLPELSDGGIGINIDPRDLAGVYSSVVGPLIAILKFVGFVVLPVFCWYVAWLRITETQVSYGI